MKNSATRQLLPRAALAATLTAPLAVAAAAPAQAAYDSKKVGQVIKLVNIERKKAGCGPVRDNKALRRAAYKHSLDMRKRNYFSHTSRDGRSPWDRIRAEGYKYASGENIAAGQRSAKSVMRAWMKSPGHRKAILNCRNKSMGVGVSAGPSTYYMYWTQTFGTR